MSKKSRRIRNKIDPQQKLDIQQALIKVEHELRNKYDEQKLYMIPQMTEDEKVDMYIKNIKFWEAENPSNLSDMEKLDPMIFCKIQICDESKKYVYETIKRDNLLDQVENKLKNI